MIVLDRPKQRFCSSRSYVLCIHQVFLISSFHIRLVVSTKAFASYTPHSMFLSTQTNIFRPNTNETIELISDEIIIGESFSFRSHPSWATIESLKHPVYPPPSTSSLPPQQVFWHQLRLILTSGKELKPFMSHVTQPHHTSRLSLNSALDSTYLPSSLVEFSLEDFAFPSHSDPNASQHTSINSQPTLQRQLVVDYLVAA